MDSVSLLPLRARRSCRSEALFVSPKGLWGMDVDVGSLEWTVANSCRIMLIILSGVVVVVVGVAEGVVLTEAE